MPRHNAALNQARDNWHRANVNQALQASSSAAGGPAQVMAASNTTATSVYLDPADARQLRGIPAVGGRGTMGGHIQGTRPDMIPFEHMRRKL